MYGQAPAYASPAAPYAGSYAMQPYARPNMVVGQAAPDQTQTFGDKASAFLNDTTLNVANKWWLTGAVAVGVIWYGKTQRWF